MCVNMDMGAKNTGFIVLNLGTGGCHKIKLKKSCDMEFTCQKSQAFSLNHARRLSIGKRWSGANKSLLVPGHPHMWCVGGLRLTIVVPRSEQYPV